MREIKKIVVRVIQTVLFLLLFVTCENQINKSILNDIIIFKEKFCSKLFEYYDLDFFRSNLKNESYVEILYPSAIAASGYSGIYLLNSYDKNEFSSVLANIEKRKLTKFSLKDSSKYIELTNQNIGKILNRFPIPNLHDDFNRLHERINIDEAVIFVMNKELIYCFINEKLQDDFASNKTMRKFIENHDNGFATGMIVDPTSQKILYWLLIW